MSLNSLEMSFMSEPPLQMAHMPDSITYEAEYQYWPWGGFIDFVADWVCKNSPSDRRVLDYMCGTGLLLRNIRDRRPDLRLAGCDINPNYVEHAIHTHGLAEVQECDALAYPVREPFDLIICTAGLHHLTRDTQQAFLAKAATELCSGGIFVLGEEVIGHYANELERQLSVLQLNHALLDYAVRRGATKPVLSAATDVLANDLLERGEYKSSLGGLVEIVSQLFSIETVYRHWPGDSAQFGDVLLICTKKSLGQGSRLQVDARL